MNPFTEGLYVIFQRNRYVRREGEMDMEKQKAGGGAWVLCNYMNFVLLLASTHAHWLYTSSSGQPERE